MDMSEAAKSALVGAEPRQGAYVVQNGSQAELDRLGYVGPAGGLTGKGVVARETLLTALLDKAFG